jgi:hypothetical protein
MFQWILDAIALKLSCCCSPCIPKPFLRQAIHPQSTHRVTMAAFWRTFHHDGKISPGLWGVGCTPPPFTHLPSRKKLQCTLRLRGQIHSSPTYALFVQANAPCTPVLLDSLTSRKGHCTASPLPRPMPIFIYCSFLLVRLTVYHICLEKTSEPKKQR